MFPTASLSNQVAAAPTITTMTSFALRQFRSLQKGRRHFQLSTFTTMTELQQPQMGGIHHSTTKLPSQLHYLHMPERCIARNPTCSAVPAELEHHPGTTHVDPTTSPLYIRSPQQRQCQPLPKACQLLLLGPLLLLLLLRFLLQQLLPQAAHVSAQADEVQCLTLDAVLAGVPAHALEPQHDGWLAVTLARSHARSDKQAMSKTSSRRHKQAGRQSKGSRPHEAVAFSIKRMQSKEHEQCYPIIVVQRRTGTITHPAQFPALILSNQFVRQHIFMLQGTAASRLLRSPATHSQSSASSLQPAACCSASKLPPYGRLWIHLVAVHLVP